MRILMGPQAPPPWVPSAESWRWFGSGAADRGHSDARGLVAKAQDGRPTVCGILGILTYRSDAGAWRDPVRRGMELMARRGPDGSGLWSDDDACVLGFRRLSILDLSEAGNQPMLTRDGRFALVFNGELYNFRELRRT